VKNFKLAWRPNIDTPNATILCRHDTNVQSDHEETSFNPQPRARTISLNDQPQVRKHPPRPLPALSGVRPHVQIYPHRLLDTS
jgi:hypothetical protein